ncbi:MAG: phosphotransferase family protein [Nocardioidaceae bacterium]
MTDRPGEVRDEDAFDVPAAAAWLAKNAAGAVPAGTPQVSQFPGGASNLTYLLSYPGRNLILRRPPPGAKARGAHDMHREFVIQQRLKPVYDCVPTMVAFCADREVIGSDFYVMEPIVGRILRRDLPPGLELSPDQASELCRTMVDRLVELHAVDPATGGLTEIGKGTGYVGRQVSGWSDRFRRARTDNVPGFESVMSWLDAEQPDDVRTCVIHNDYRFDNAVLSLDEPLRVIGVLDWEMATLGDPLMDLGSAMAYWIQHDDEPAFQAMRKQPTDLPGMWSRAQVVEHYLSRTGLTCHSWTFYEVFGLFRIAAILQQIYVRYARGQTHNPAFANFWRSVNHLDVRCRAIIEEAGA